MGRDRKGMPVWFWIGCGCVSAVGVSILVVVGLVFLGFRALEGFTDDMADPAIRDERVRELLGVDELPDGLLPQMSFRVPFLMEFVLLSDLEPTETTDIDEPEESGIFREQIFAYLRLRWGEFGEEDMKSLAEGRSAPNARIRTGFVLAQKERLDKGEFEIGDQRIRYEIHRGEAAFNGGAVIDVVYAGLIVGCGEEPPRRAGILIRRDDTAGSAIERAELGEFMTYFDLCHSGERREA